MKITVVWSKYSSTMHKIFYRCFSQPSNQVINHFWKWHFTYQTILLACYPIKTEHWKLLQSCREFFKKSFTMVGILIYCVQNCVTDNNIQSWLCAQIYIYNCAFPMNCLRSIKFFVFRVVTTFLVSIERAFYEDYGGMVKIFIYNAQNILSMFFAALQSSN